MINHQKTEESVIEKFLTLIIWILGIISVYWLILKLTDHSPLFEQISILLLTTLGGVVARHNYKLEKLDQFKEY